MNPFLFAIWMFAVAIGLNILVSFVLNACSSKKRKSQKEENLVTVTSGVKKWF